MDKKCRYLEKYLKFGFTSLFSYGIEKPQCVLCHAVLSAKLIKLSKLKQHQRLDFTGNFQQENAAIVQASYEVALEITQQKKMNMFGEPLIKSCLLKTVILLLREPSEAKMKQVSFSNNTIQRCISDTSEDAKEQVINEIKAFLMFLKVDKTTDVASCAQLLFFVRYIHLGDVKETFLFCS